MAKTIAERKHVGENDAISSAVLFLKQGQLVALPTETVYGLGADALNRSAIQKIYQAKNRPSYNPLICHVSDIDMAKRFVEVDETAERLMAAFWPGPLTIVLPQKLENPISDIVSAGLDTLAVRCPNQITTRQIIKELDRPLAAPSANPSGKLSPTTADDVLETLGDKVSAVIDAGACPVGIESTIVSVEDGHIKLLRPGSITAQDISALGFQVLPEKQDTQKAISSPITAPQVTAPGQLESHYAPDALLRLNALVPEDDEIFIGFDTIDGDFNLSPGGNLDEAAKNLFSTLRLADKKAHAGKKNQDFQSRHGRIAIAPIPNTGIGRAINDRLARAAAPRPDMMNK